MSKDEQGPCSQTLTNGFNMKAISFVVGRILLAARQNISIKFEHAISRFDVMTTINVVGTIVLKNIFT